MYRRPDDVTLTAYVRCRLHAEKTWVYPARLDVKGISLTLGLYPLRGAHHE
jgi:hypothetical protein